MEEELLRKILWVVVFIMLLGALYLLFRRLGIWG